MTALRRKLKFLTATDTLASELRRVRRAIVRSVGIDHPALPAAVAALLTHVDVYRTDYRGLAAVMSTALADTIAAQPELAEPLRMIAAAPAAENPRYASSNCAAPSRRSRWRIACSTVTHGWCRSTRSAANPNTSASAPRSFITVRRCGHGCGPRP